MKQVGSLFLASSLLLSSIAFIPNKTLAATAVVQQQQANPLNWEGWSDTVFERAKKEHKFVILDLEAIWCHWCHVMAEVTYQDPSVIKILKSKFITVRVDQDSRPDLSARYMDYGWPATIFYAPDGTELVKRAGYIEPEEMTKLLTAILKDPTPEKGDTDQATPISNFAKDPYLSADLRKGLEDEYLSDFDQEYGAWGSGGHKFLDWDSMEYSLIKAKGGDTQAEAMAKKTLDGERNLLDPVWGGLFQYSTDGDWTHPHYERIMSVQAENMRIFAQAYRQFKNPKDLETAQAVNKFLNDFLKDPNGAFYTSMDADLVQGEHSDAYFKLGDEERRKLGIPRVDKHQYARENGWVANALISLYEATGDKSYLEEATTAVNWVIANRSLEGGGFSHSEKDAAGPFLGDSVSMGRALMSLYRVTGDRSWLNKAEKTAEFIETHFANQNDKPGFISAVPTSSYITPILFRDENALTARFTNNLYQSTGNQKYRTLSESAMKYLATPEVANQAYTATSLLPDFELSKAPTHITIVGHKDDPAAQALLQAALSYPAIYKRIDWWDKREGPMPNPDVTYPELEKAAAFVCTQNRCSLPVFQPDALAPLVDRLTLKATTQVH